MEAKDDRQIKLEQPNQSVPPKAMQREILHHRVLLEGECHRTGT